MQSTDPLARVTQGFDSAFPAREFAIRIEALRALMAERELDVYATTGPENIFYLSGQQTPGYYAMQCLVVPLDGRPFLIVRALESFNARANSYLDDIEPYGDTVRPGDALVESFRRRGLVGKRIGFDKDAWFLSPNLYDSIVSTLGPVHNAGGLVERLRRVKSKLELDALDKAGHIADVGMAAGLPVVKVGASENDVAAAVMGAMVSAGSEYFAMEPFVTSGPRGGLPHTTWRRRRFEQGDVVIIENAGCYNRYHTGIFRTVVLGAPHDGIRARYDACREALERGLERVAPGVTCAEVHETVQAVIDKAGFSEGYRKRAGYSQGIAFAPDWGEGNVLSLNRGVDVPLQAGMAFHLPVTLRDYMRFTVAVSDTFIVTETGCRTLSTLPRDLVVA